MNTLAQQASAKPANVSLDRFYYTIAGAIFLVVTVIGFQHYIFEGKHFDGTSIDPSILATVVVHGTAIFAWYVLFFVQSLLISTQNRRLHMKLGWIVLVIAPVITLNAPLVAIRSVRLDPSAIAFDWDGRQFLLILYTAEALYVAFVVIGVINRKRPRIHRPMMLLAGLTMLTAPTTRMHLVNSIFGLHTWMAFYGPVVSLGALLLLGRMAMTRRFEREFAIGFGAFVVVTVLASRVAVTDLWDGWAGKILVL